MHNNRNFNLFVKQPITSNYKFQEINTIAIMSLAPLAFPKLLSSTSSEDLDLNELITMQLIHVDNTSGSRHKVLTEDACCTPTTLAMINFNNIRENSIIRVNKHFITNGEKGYVKEQKITVLIDMDIVGSFNFAIGDPKKLNATPLVVSESNFNNNESSSPILP